MPELPEVETVCRGLRPYLEGAILDSVILNRPDLRYPFPVNFKKYLRKVRIKTVDRKAKYILIHLENNYTLIIHLGMSGRLLINPTNASIHDHVHFIVEEVIIIYKDPRRFGFMDLVPTAKIGQHKFLKKLGIDPLSKALTNTYLGAHFQRRKSPIKTTLLNQNIIAGLGNIYVNEALFASGIHPEKNCNELKSSELKTLCEAIKNVLKKAILSGGSTLNDHRQVDGILGYFQHEFKVYNKENLPCKLCTTPIRRIVQSGRSTFYCPFCQQ
ncbi:MAG: bifunctional DNA-formamidopyrimidine glycosylase/DNA-(apurinic or apyrimidinic site) lyase [Alphaproteobacteria bacterium]|nr:bifunctional DNA-formamidopyrimidine glycosylase/DNA-(apurinic or apyrimidinic site) lyase [Alphaproteobacteria bacterium]